MSFESIEKEYNSRECPNCHSIKSRIILHLNKYSCMDCNHTWKREKEVDNDIIKWYIVGCHIIQNPNLDEYNKEQFIGFLNTLKQMSE